MLATAPSPAALTAPAPEIAEAESGIYVTDGERLLRVVEPLRGAWQRSTALIEDCLTLEILCLTADELWRMRLRPVRPLPTPAQ